MSMLEAPATSTYLQAPSTETIPTSKQNKRRSLLPQFSRKTSGEVDTIKEDGDVAEMERGFDSVKERTGGEYERSTIQEAARKAMPPPASRLNRPTSVYGSGIGRAPTVRSQPRQDRSDPRADALAALNGTAPAPRPRTTPIAAGLSRTPSTRLPQSPAQGLSRTASVRPKEAQARTAQSTIAEKRTSTTRSRPPSIDAKANARPQSITSPPSPASSTSSRPNARPQSQLFAPSRPNFSTYQQHYSPAKSSLPKPPIPNSRISKPLQPAPIDFEDLGAPTFEVLKQQTELLQLSLLHQASLQTAQEYDTSARRQLSKKQAKLRKAHETIAAQESEQNRIASLTILEDWCPHDPSLLAENLQTLSKIHHELSSMTEHPTGRYTELVAVFERWVDSTLVENRAGTFVLALSQVWHKTHTSLALRLRALQRDLLGLPPAPGMQEGGYREGEQAALRQVLEYCSLLLDGMLRELEMMGKLEKEVLLREKARVDEEVGVLVAGDLSRVPRKWVPVWQSVT
ncbi:hypothetical protein LTR62_007525 [Meristemomyces frigidus]|uniref:Uncharacterized protein n=1 Tax=Meristemomyces frigidus TaxID=1508187 RepID=A0AAN7YNX4_9PEZI|nr:hypothetical protein LTR62_007525 [Meristemomyces frigidus]